MNLCFEADKMHWLEMFETSLTRVASLNKNHLTGGLNKLSLPVALATQFRYQRARILVIKLGK